jgi:hypothetical protein
MRAIAAALLLLALLPSVEAVSVDDSAALSDSPTEHPCGLLPVSRMSFPVGIAHIGLCSGPFVAPYLEADGTFSGICLCV